MMRFSLLPFLLVSCALLASCPEKPKPQTTRAEQSTASKTTNETSAEALENAADAEVKQLIIIYTGDTLSEVNPPAGFSPPQGGLPALAAAVAEYQRSIVYFNQLRVSDAGGDPSTIRADRTAGLLGEHPYLLVDYGGWERPNDFAGAPLVALSLQYFRDYGYHAVGARQFVRLPELRWQQYRAVNPGVTLLASAGAARAGALASLKQIVREVHGAKWCIVSVPLPPEDADLAAAFGQYVAAAWEQVQQSGAEFSILLMSGAPSQLYRDLAADERFTVVIGAPAKLALAPGFGKLEPSLTVLLPEVNASGRQFGVCHLQYGGGARPTAYHLLLNDCLEDPAKPFPYRDQAAAAWQAHEQLVAEQLSTAKIGTP